MYSEELSYLGLTDGTDLIWSDDPFKDKYMYL